MGKLDFAPEAIADIKAIADVIAEAGGRERAERYIARLQRRLAALEVFPGAGRRLARGRPATRVLGFERRVTILFRRRPGSVLILRVLYAGRQP